MAGGDKRRRRKRIGDGVDRNSELPVHLREHILEYLTLKEAVATRVLSSKWRCCWTGLRKLDFDEEFWYPYGDSELVKYLECGWAVDRVLMLHRGPIREFILFVPEIEDKTLDINVWLCVLSNNGVKKITITAHRHQDITFRIPSYLFHCRELEKLWLDFCILTPPSDFKGFANLTYLSLVDVRVTPCLLGSLISRCLLLEVLSLIFLGLGEPLVIEALNLKTFYYEGHELEHIIFKSIPKLTHVSLLSGDDGKMYTPVAYNTRDRLCPLSMVEELTFDFLLLEHLCEKCQSMALTPFENLKSLTMRSVDLCLSEDVSFTLWLIRSAPSLQNLTIHVHTDFGIGFETDVQEEARKLLKSEVKDQHTSYNSLQTIHIRGIQGFQNENLLIKLLQTRCRKVKSIIIHSED